jgi:carbon monoxide dehydrogenase subunit G
MAEKEGWSKDKVFELLRDPTKLAKAIEGVSIKIFFLK